MPHTDRTLFPATNDWGIPDLLPGQQALIIRPVMHWGFQSQSAYMPGTWVFYCDDYKFSRLLGRPEQVLDSQCCGAVEPNITVLDDEPAVKALWAQYQKRLVARTWQELGLNVTVDLNIPSVHLDLVGIGLPANWWSFATRGYSRRVDALEREWGWAKAWAGERLQLLVYGGGKYVRDACRELSGTVWIESDTRALSGRETKNV